MRTPVSRSLDRRLFHLHKRSRRHLRPAIEPPVAQKDGQVVRRPSSPRPARARSQQRTSIPMVAPTRQEPMQRARDRQDRIAPVPGHVEAFTHSQAVRPANGILTRRERQKALRKIDQQGPWPDAPVDQSPHHEVARWCLSTQNAEVKRRNTETLLQDSRQDSQLDQAVAHAKNVRAAFRPTRCTPRLSPAHLDTSARISDARSRHHQTLDHGDHRSRADQADRERGSPGGPQGHGSILDPRHGTQRGPLPGPRAFIGISVLS